MSHGYGSLRGIIGFWLVTVSVILLAGSSAAADSPAIAPAGSDVVIMATIKPVRIIVVDDHDRITEIFSNGPGNVTPSVHRGNSEGSTITMNTSISEQYSRIKSHVDWQRTGKVYSLEDHAPKQTRGVFNPKTISILVSEFRVLL